MSSYLLDDPVADLLEDEKPSAEIVPDPINGYDRVVLDPAKLDELGRMYAAAIKQTDDDLKPQHEKVAADQLTYECESRDGEVITLPLAKRIANQQMAWGATAILSKDPYITIKALDGGSYQIPNATYTGDIIPGFEELGPIPEYDLKEVSGSDAATLYQRLIQYDLTNLIEFEQLVEDLAFSIHVGESPTYWKIPYDQNVRHAKRRMMQQLPEEAATPGKPGRPAGRVAFLGVEDTTVAGGPAVTIKHIYGPNLTMPVGETDLQRAWWVAEKMRPTNIELWEGFKKGTYNLCAEPGKDGMTPEASPEEIKQILGLAENPNNSLALAAQISLQQIDRLVAQNPRKDHDVREVWFFHPLRTDKGIEVRSLCGTLHMASGKFLNLYCNTYWHGKRPYVPFFMQKRPHKHAGYNTVANVAPMQKLMSLIFHGQVNSLVQQNVKVYLVKENSATWRHMNLPGFQLRPGVVIPFAEKDDINPSQLGASVQSMAAEVSFLDDTADKLTVSRDFAAIPNRTPAATVAQIDANATVQPATILRSMRRGIAAAMKMYFQTMAQFHQYRTIPFLDEDDNKLTMTLIGFPREVIENQFSFAVTATGDDDTKQAKQEKTLLNLVQTDKANESVMKLMDIILDPGPPEEAKDVAAFCLERREHLYGDLMVNSGLDRARFSLSPATIQKLRDSAKATAAAAPPPPPPPPPPPDQPKVNFTGLVPPEYILAILQQAFPGLQIAAAPPQLPLPPPQQGAPPNAAPNPQLPPAPGGQALPALPAGAGGPQLPPGEPGNAGVGIPGPPAAPIQAGIPTAG